MGQSIAAERPRPEVAHSDLAVDAARSVTNQRLADSMLHDVRNPLNALSINLDVLSEKIRRELGEIPPAQEKNLKVMREQIHRIDAILREYLEFIAPRPESIPVPVNVSEITARALKVLGHECRRSMIRVRPLVEPELRISATDAGAVRFLVMQVLFRGAARAGQDGELEVTLQRDGPNAALRVRDARDSRDDAAEPYAFVLPAIERMSVQLGAEMRRTGSELVLSLPLKQEG